MINKQLNKFNIILGSASTRRKELLSDIGLKFSIQTTDKEETYPNNLATDKIAEFLAHQKSNILSKKLCEDDLLITADTIVLLNEEVLHKPKDKSDAYKILNKISNNTHKVITGVCIKNINKEIVFSVTSFVTFRKLKKNEIEFYINNFNPLDKSGAYGIQDWIGKIGVKNINGSYTNIIGLPLSETYENIKLFI